MTDLAFAHPGGVAMPKTLIRILVLGALGLIHGNAQAQTPVAGGHNIPRMVEGEALKPDGSFYVGGYSGARDFTPYRVHLYDFRSERDSVDRQPDWLPWAVRLTGSGTQSRRVEWADGRTCPGVYSVQVAMADFPAGRFRAPRFIDLPAGAGGPPSPPLDTGAPSLAFWGYASLTDMAFGTMMITGSDGLIRQWVDFADTQLQDCWTTEPPEGIATRDMLQRLPEVDPTWPADLR
jgi:hypothetical protein